MLKQFMLLSTPPQLFLTFEPDTDSHTDMSYMAVWPGLSGSKVMISMWIRPGKQKAVLNLAEKSLVYKQIFQEYELVTTLGFRLCQ